MNPLSRDQLVELATRSYFGNVDRKDLEAVLDCFHDTAHLTVQTAFTRHDGKAALRRMFRDFFTAYARIRHYDFDCIVDEKEQRINARFDVELVDERGVATALYNTNFWRVRDGRFQEVFVYMSGANPLV